MTAQEIFDRVWRHFVTEGNPRSIDEYGQCLYRGPNGARCAIGLLIPDAEYSPAIDVGTFNGVYDVLSSETCPPTLLALREHKVFLAALQSAHDNGESPGSLASRLERVARSYGLTVPS